MNRELLFTAGLNFVAGVLIARSMYPNRKNSNAMNSEETYWNGYLNGVDAANNRNNSSYVVPRSTPVFKLEEPIN